MNKLTIDKARQMLKELSYAKAQGAISVKEELYKEALEGWLSFSTNAYEPVYQQLIGSSWFYCDESEYLEAGDDRRRMWYESGTKESAQHD